MTNPKTFVRTKSLPLILAAIALCILLCLLANYHLEKLPAHTTLAGVDVGNMTRREAADALQPLQEQFAREPMVISFPDGSLTLSPEQTAVSLDIGKAVTAAYSQSRAAAQDKTETTQTQPVAVSLQDCLEWDETAIVSALDAYAQQYNSVFTETHVALEGDAPALREDLYDPEASGQTLVIRLGTPGQMLDTSEIYHQIADTYCQGSFQLDLTGLQPEKTPEIPNLENLYQEFCTAPTDAALSLEDWQISPASYGYGFDLQNAQTLLSQAQYGDCLEIPMELRKPEKRQEDLYFQDVLGSYISGHSDLPNLAQNLKLVCQYLDGIVLQPGEVFSYNDAVGERTVERGFYYGETFIGLERGRSAGGGVCQGSSVLHVCVLEADLEVVERVSHGLTVGYTPLGQDAAVSWGGPDFRFRNSTNFPIRIVAEYNDKDIRMKLMGTDEKDYYIQLEATQGQDENQIYANCYKRKYDKLTGELISRELAVHSAYLNVSE